MRAPFSSPANEACDEVAVFADPLGTHFTFCSLDSTLAVPGKLRPKSVDQSEVDCGQKTIRLRHQTTCHKTLGWGSSRCLGSVWSLGPVMKSVLKSN